MGLVDVKVKGQWEIGTSNDHVDGCKFYLTDEGRALSERH